MRLCQLIFKHGLLFVDGSLIGEPRIDSFYVNILFTDEVFFKRDAIINFHNIHAWSDGNPYATLASRHQYRFLWRFRQEFSAITWLGLTFCLSRKVDWTWRSSCSAALFTEFKFVRLLFLGTFKERSICHISWQHGWHVELKTVVDKYEKSLASLKMF